MTLPTKTGPCPCCGAELGQPHGEDCEVARCLQTGLQAYTCGVWHDHGRDVWPGEWPGWAECREFGWFSRPGLPGGQWERSEPDAYGSLPHLSRLYAEALWDVRNQRWRKALTFMAKIAPLGVTSVDGRRLMRSRNWTLRPGAPVWLDLGEELPRVTVGRLTAIEMGPDAIFVRGVLLDDPGIYLAGLLPEMGLMLPTRHRGAWRMADDEGGPPVYLLTAGEVVALKLGRAPAFTGLWIAVNRDGA